MRQPGRWRWGLSATGGALSAFIAALVLHQTAPWPRGDVARGSEDAFAQGLYPREIRKGGGLQRWTKDRVRISFRSVPPGISVLEVRVRAHRGPVAVAVDGVWVGAVQTTESARRFVLRDARSGRREVELVVPVFDATDGRRLGALFESVSLEHPRSLLPSVPLLGSLLGVALVTVLAGGACGLGPVGSGLSGALLAALQAFLLWPSGLLRSPYAASLTCLLLMGVFGAWAFAFWARRRLAGSGPWAFVAILTSWVTLAVVATSPLMVMSDAVFHANNLARVAGGDLFPVSVTQHARPFRFPYGVSFYALLAPLYRAGIDGVTLVRFGAAFSAIAASAAFFVLLSRMSPATATMSVALLQMQPLVFDAFSYGNLSNVFGQSATLLFFVWWAGKAPGGWPTGSALLALACLSHFGSFVILVALCGSLAFIERRSLRTDAKRPVALAVGLLLALLYYAMFVPLIFEQLPRLLEGGGQGRGPSQGTWDVLRLAVAEAGRGWGVPAIVLALWGRPRFSRSGPERSLAAFWLSGLLLAVMAVVSPVDVRYLYALTGPLAVAAGMGLMRLWERGGMRRVLVALLLAWEGGLGTLNMVEALLWRYR